MKHEVGENILISEKAILNKTSVHRDTTSNPSPLFMSAHNSISMMPPQDNILILVNQNYDTVGMEVKRYWEAVSIKIDSNGKKQKTPLYKVDINDKRLRK
ncbi:hypothetical protein [Chryseobacterium sp. NKUCC03_KSP]|uniref:hypothetical protein n=1 Tax=Chryseobacterium sp. NKUCC03_KSP TaxID=2842125 RepID=UPI001C5B3F07|nr:hypothetical protein [Chryseobacterium sp. NKUCC03_KSP]MBW3524902.1 hypothetical protein [Chryseobacterium sp. NKUCC03_KSP]